MLTLRSVPASPFGRKVKIAAALCGLTERIRVVPADTMSAEDSLRRENPLGKIPTLILEDGTALYDSRVICEWLDAEAGGGIVIPQGAPRFPALRMQALADGIMDASLLIVYEGRFRPEEKRHALWVEHQADKVARGLAAFEAEKPERAARPHIGQIALACALGYRDLRFGEGWREGYPRLADWLAAFEAAVPSYAATRASG